MDKITEKSVGRQTKIFRRALGMKLSDVAKMLFVSEAELSAFEKGEYWDNKLCVTLIYYYYFQFTFPKLERLLELKKFSQTNLER